MEHLAPGKQIQYTSSLKNDAKTICSLPYLVPKVHEEIFKKEVEHLVLLGVLKVANDPEWGAPYFAQPKPE